MRRSIIRRNLKARVKGFIYARQNPRMGQVEDEMGFLKDYCWLNAAKKGFEV